MENNWTQRAVKQKTTVLVRWFLPSIKSRKAQKVRIFPSPSLANWVTFATNTIDKSSLWLGKLSKWWSSRGYSKSDLPCWRIVYLSRLGPTSLSTRPSLIVCRMISPCTGANQWFRHFWTVWVRLSRNFYVSPSEPRLKTPLAKVVLAQL